MDSDMFSHEPPKGVYKGMIPFWISHSTMLSVLWPERLSQTSNARNGGKSLGSGGGLSSPIRHSSHTARFVSGSKAIAGGSLARISLNSCFSQGWRTALVQLVTPLMRTSPVRRVKQCQDLGCAIANILVRVTVGLALGCPRFPAIGNGLEWPGFIFGPDAQAEGFAAAIGKLDQVFFPSVSGSVTSTTPSLRLRGTVPVLHQVRSFCQVQPASCNTHQIV